MAEKTVTQSDNDDTITFEQRNNEFKTVRDHWYRNDLLALAGYLEFFNALDFPANVWNQIPVPTFAKGLMIAFGSSIILSSSIAWLDLYRSLRNIRLLREERVYLLNRIDRQRMAQQPTTHLEAWLSLNFRELGWELFDRSLLDIFVGFASLLVGTGTIMAMAGANRHIFRASNLLSGYVGNGLVAAYGLINSFWSVYLFVRATRHKRLVREYVKDEIMRKRAHKIFYGHQQYALFNGITLLVSGAGSLISATMWWGYVILIPCVISSIYCNQLWRRAVGYNRVLTLHRSNDSKDVYEDITNAVRAQELLKDGGIDTILKKYPRAASWAFLFENEMLEEIGVLLTNTTRLSGKSTKSSLPLARIERQTLEAIDITELPHDIKIRMSKRCLRTAVDMERMLWELLGSFLTITKIERERLRISNEKDQATTPINEDNGLEAADLRDLEEGKRKVQQARSPGVVEKAENSISNALNRTL